MPSNESKIGILLTNLGSPDAPDKASVKKYLKQFLSDPRVIHSVAPRWVWWIILRVLILPARPKNSAKLYKKIWDSFGEGAPLVAITTLQQKALQKVIPHYQIEIAMRYGKPTISKGINNLIESNVKEILVLPLLPQHSRTTTESIIDEVKSLRVPEKYSGKIHLINDYHDNLDYINALKQSVLKHQQEFGKPQKLMVSYHGIPEIYRKLGDNYHLHCEKTTELLVKELELKPDEYIHCYQSHFGNQVWLKPYLDCTIKELPKQGVIDIQVICPGFSADCLETIEEIEHENKNYFMGSGGKKYSYITALNDTSDHINCLSRIIKNAIT